MVSALKEIRETLGLKPALLEELAADIFMGEFSPKFEAHGDLAYEALKDKLYGRYYELRPIPASNLIYECERR
jgi:hypothetical protein